MAQPTNGGGQSISIKDAAEFVPRFDGHNIPLIEFLDACSEAKGMIDPISEEKLVRLLRMRIYGEARRTLSGKTLETVNHLTRHLRDMYDTAETYEQLLGKLGYEIQRSGEGVIPFANRVREIGNRIVECRKRENGTISEATKGDIHKVVMECFKRGLRPEIESRIPTNIAIEEITREAVRIERQLEARNSLLASIQGRETNRKGLQTHQQHRKEEQKFSESKPHHTYRDEPKSHPKNSCQICNRPGHSAPDCFKIQICQNCKQKGHIAKYCKTKAVTTTSVACQLCNRTGHVATACSTKEKPTICQLCGKTGHIATACSKNTQTTDVPFCKYCKTKGHEISDCKKRDYNNKQKNMKGFQATSARKEDPPATTHSVNPIEIDDTLLELLSLE